MGVNVSFSSLVFETEASGHAELSPACVLTFGGAEEAWLLMGDIIIMGIYYISQLRSV